MKVENITQFDGVKLITPQKFEDHRGAFCEIYNQGVFRQNGIDIDFVQDNQSFSLNKGTVRGLHFQSPPFGQAKLIRVLSGKILDVIVDIHRSSPTYGQYDMIHLDPDLGQQLFIPVGFAHGFCTLEDHTEILYKVSALYSRDHDGGIFWNDPDLGIRWPVTEKDAVLSDKDKQLPLLKQLVSPYE